ncbi:molybdopterin-synthase adenylyltransferase MoeB [Oceanicaulis sp. MMSF_3324]|uniref:HesA/MoeB/ThiF family protein n=1 Tax=Oceanicaulis sp. MMSF_3324 TaxID=3046702 RepID=UPI00273FCA76|nr:molybdopterin-synthase adenylyltransferase MoeB [Oceanicaulis sp. MMSF_3324]
MAVDVKRHARHIVLKELGGPGQQKLSRARITVIGAGGLGAPALLYLAAAGVGQLRIVDPDTVSLSNLQRQILFRTEDVDASKVERAKDALTALDPGIDIDPVSVKATQETLPGLLADSDLVLDGCDDFETRFAVNRAALDARIPLVSGAVGRWDGQIGVFAPHLKDDAPCYQCWVPEIPPDAEDCAVMGVVGALTGVIGSMMAMEAIKLISGAGEPLLGRIGLYDGLSGRMRTVSLPASRSCPACASDRTGTPRTRRV